MKCTFCPSDAVTSTKAGLPICKACADKAPVLMNPTPKVEKLAKTIAHLLKPK